MLRRLHLRIRRLENGVGIGYMEEKKSQEKQTNVPQGQSSRYSSTADDDGSEETAGKGQPFLLRPPSAEPHRWRSGALSRNTLSTSKDAVNETQTPVDPAEMLRELENYYEAHSGSSSRQNQEPIPTFANEQDREKAELVRKRTNAFRTEVRNKLKQAQEFRRSGGNWQKFSHEKLPELLRAANAIPADMAKNDMAHTLITAERTLREIPPDLWGKLQEEDDSATRCAAELHAAVEALLDMAKELQGFSAIKAEIEKLAASESVQEKAAEAERFRERLAASEPTPRSMLGLVEMDTKPAEARLKEVTKETCAAVKKDFLQSAAPYLKSAARALAGASRAALEMQRKYATRLNDEKSQARIIADTVGLQELSVTLGKVAKKMAANKAKPEEDKYISTTGMSKVEKVLHYADVLLLAPERLRNFGARQRLKRDEDLRQQRASGEKSLSYWEMIKQKLHNTNVNTKEGNFANDIYDKAVKIGPLFKLGFYTLASQSSTVGRKIRAYYYKEIKYTLKNYKPEKATMRVALSTAGLPLLNEAYILREAIDQFTQSEQKDKKERKQSKMFTRDPLTSSFQEAAEKAIKSAEKVKEQVTPKQLEANSSAALELVEPALKEKAEALLKSPWNMTGTSPQETFKHAGATITKAANALIHAAQKVNTKQIGAKAAREVDVLNARSFVIDAKDDIKYATAVMFGNPQGKYSRSVRSAKDLGQWLHNYKTNFKKENPQESTEWIDNAFYAELDPSSNEDPKGQAFIKQIQMAELDAACGRLYLPPSYKDLLKQFDSLESYITKWGEKQLVSNIVRRSIYAVLRGIAGVLTLGLSEIGSYALRRSISTVFLVLKTASEWKKTRLLKESVPPGSALPESAMKEMEKRFKQKLHFRLSMLLLPSGVKALMAVGLTGYGYAKHKDHFRKYWFKRFKSHLTTNLLTTGTFRSGIESFNAQARFGQRMATLEKKDTALRELEDRCGHDNDLIHAVRTGDFSLVFQHKELTIKYFKFLETSEAPPAWFLDLKKRFGNEYDVMYVLFLGDFSLAFEDENLMDKLLKFLESEADIQASSTTIQKQAPTKSAGVLSPGGEKFNYKEFTEEVDPKNAPRYTAKVRRYKLGKKMYLTRAHRVGEETKPQARRTRLVINAHGRYDKSSLSAPVKLSSEQKITFLQPHGYDLINPRADVGSRLADEQNPDPTRDRPFATVQGGADSAGPVKVVYASSAAKSMPESEQAAAITGGITGGLPDYTFSKYQSQDKEASDENYRQVKDAAAQDVTIDHLTIRDQEGGEVRLSEVLEALAAAGIHYDEIIMNTCRSSEDIESADAPDWFIEDNQRDILTLTLARQDRDSGVKTKNKRSVPDSNKDDSVQQDAQVHNQQPKEGKRLRALRHLNKEQTDETSRKRALDKYMVGQHFESLEPEDVQIILVDPKGKEIASLTIDQFMSYGAYPSMKQKGSRISIAILKDNGRKNLLASRRFTEWLEDERVQEVYHDNTHIPTREIFPAAVMRGLKFIAPNMELDRLIEKSPNESIRREISRLEQALKLALEDPIDSLRKAEILELRSALKFNQTALQLFELMPRLHELKVMGRFKNKKEFNILISEVQNELKRLQFVTDEEISRLRRERELNDIRLGVQYPGQFLPTDAIDDSRTGVITSKLHHAIALINEDDANTELVFKKNVNDLFRSFLAEETSSRHFTREEFYKKIIKWEEDHLDLKIEKGRLQSIAMRKAWDARFQNTEGKIENEKRQNAIESHINMHYKDAMPNLMQRDVIYSYTDDEGQTQYDFIKLIDYVSGGKNSIHASRTNITIQWPTDIPEALRQKLEELGHHRHRALYDRIKKIIAHQASVSISQDEYEVGTWQAARLGAMRLFQKEGQIGYIKISDSDHGDDLMQTANQILDKTAPRYSAVIANKLLWMEMTYFYVSDKISEIKSSAPTEILIESFYNLDTLAFLSEEEISAYYQKRFNFSNTMPLSDIKPRSKFESEQSLFWTILEALSPRAENEKMRLDRTYYDQYAKYNETAHEEAKISIDQKIANKKIIKSTDLNCPPKRMYTYKPKAFITAPGEQKVSITPLNAWNDALTKDPVRKVLFIEADSGKKYIFSTLSEKSIFKEISEDAFSQYTQEENFDPEKKDSQFNSFFNLIEYKHNDPEISFEVTDFFIAGNIKEASLMPVWVGKLMAKLMPSSTYRIEKDLTASSSSSSSLREILEEHETEGLKARADDMKEALYSKSYIQKWVENNVPFAEMHRKALADSGYTASLEDWIFDTVDAAITLVSMGIPVMKLSIGGFRAGKAALASGRSLGLKGSALRAKVITDILPHIKTAGKIVGKELAEFAFSPFSLLDQLSSLGKNSKILKAGDGAALDNYSKNIAQTIKPKWGIDALPDDIQPVNGIYRVERPPEGSILEAGEYIKVNDQFYKVYRDEDNNTWRVFDKDNLATRNRQDPPITQDENGRWIYNMGAGGVGGTRALFEPYRQRSDIPNTVHSPQVETELTNLKRRVESDSVLEGFINTPKENCANAIEPVIKILQDNGFEDIKVRGIYIWLHEKDSMPSNHFVVIGTKNGQEYVVDATAAQFKGGKTPQLNGPLYMTESDWAKMYQDAFKDKLVKYKDYKKSADAKIEFGPTGSASSYPMLPTEEANRLTEPSWYTAAQKEIYAGRKKATDYVDPGMKRDEKVAKETQKELRRHNKKIKKYPPAETGMYSIEITSKMRRLNKIDGILHKKKIYEYDKKSGKYNAPSKDFKVVKIPDTDFMLSNSDVQNSLKKYRDEYAKLRKEDIRNKNQNNAHGERISAKEFNEFSSAVNEDTVSTEYYVVVRKSDKGQVLDPNKIYGIACIIKFKDPATGAVTVKLEYTIAHPWTQVPPSYLPSNENSSKHNVRGVGSFLMDKVQRDALADPNVKEIKTNAVNPRSAAIAKGAGMKLNTPASSNVPGPSRVEPPNRVGNQTEQQPPPSANNVPDITGRSAEAGLSSIEWANADPSRKANIVYENAVKSPEFYALKAQIGDDASERFLKDILFKEDGVTPRKTDDLESFDTEMRAMKNQLALEKFYSGLRKNDNVIICG